MSRSSLKRALGSLKRLVRRSSPRDQQWLRLILLVRKLQHGQLAFVQRLDEIRALCGAMGSFRTSFGALHEELATARESAQALEQMLGGGLQRLQSLPDPAVERRELERRTGALDDLVARLETLAGQAPAEREPALELASALVRVEELSARLKTMLEMEHVASGQDELANLYERIQELAEGLVRAPQAGPAGDETPSVSAASLSQMPVSPPPIFDGPLARLDAQLELLESAVNALGSRGNAALQRLDRAAGEPAELTSLLRRFESLAERIEQAPVALPDLPPDTEWDGPSPHEVARLEAVLVGEQEALQRADEQLRTLRDQLRSSELARVELETRHATELTQMADHVQRQLQRVEDDLKKKKRGLAELTQQNIALQARVERLQQDAAARGGEPKPALPSEPRAARTQDAPPAERTDGTKP